MWKKIIVFFFIMSFLGIPLAHADMDIEHFPTENQLQEKEAEKIACEFFYKLCGVELTDIYHLEKEEKYQGQKRYLALDTNTEWIRRKTAGTWIYGIEAIYGRVRSFTELLVKYCPGNIMI